VSSLAGWWGGHVNKPEILQRMAEVMSGPDSVVEDYCEGDLAVTTIRPRVTQDSSYIAVSEDMQAIVGFSGYLYSEEIEQRKRPAHHCLKLYEDLGAEFARELNGSFAIVICDRRAGQLLLVTDRLCTRAIYYSCQEDFVFASEVKAILQYPGIGRKVNKDRSREFLALGCVLGLDTYYDHTKQVPSASVLIWDGVGPQFVKYWEARFSWSRDGDIRELADRAVSALRGAVRRSCIGAERPGLMLSGGLDSRTIAATSDQDLLCVTMHTEEGYEVATARNVANALDYEHAFVKLPKTFPLGLLQEDAVIGDGMYIYTNAQALTLRNALYDRDVDRLLNGMMLDVCFGGLFLPARRWALFGRKLRLPLLVSPNDFEVSDDFVERHQTAGVETLDLVLGPRLTGQVMELVEARVAKSVSHHPATVQSKYDVVDWLEALCNVVKQADYLNVLAIDRLVSAAIPAYDNEVIDAFLATPPYYRFNHRIYGHMYKLLNSGLRGIPYTSTGVPISTNRWWEFARMQLDEKVARPVKRRFGRLVDQDYREPVRSSWPWAGDAMRECEEWRQELWAHASHSYLADLGVVSGDGVRTLIEQHLSGEFDHTKLLGAWLTLEEWLRHYG